MRNLTPIMLVVACLGLAPAMSIHAAEFKGIIIQVQPLLVKSLKGEVLQFQPKGATLGPNEVKVGKMVRLKYHAESSSNILDDDNLTVCGDTIMGTVVEISTDKSWLVVRAHQPGNYNEWLQTSTQFQPLVTAMQRGDGIQAVYSLDKGINHVESLEWQSVTVDTSVCAASLFGALFLLFLVAVVFTSRHPTSLYLGADNRYSNSKFQTVLWFWVVISAYCATIFLRLFELGGSYIGGVNIPQNLLILSGISVLTFAAAKAITVGKVEQSAAKGGDLKPAAQNAKAGDLVNDDFDRTDFGDFQMLVITFMAVIIYAITVFQFMRRMEFRSLITMPDVDSTLLAIFGLGQAAYLGKKAAGEVGTGVTSDQAVKSASDAASAAKQSAEKAATWLELAKQKKGEAEQAAADAKAASEASDKAMAILKSQKAQTAAKEARKAVNDAAAEQKTAEARASDAQKLASNWANVQGAATSTEASSKSAKEAAEAAKKAAGEADDAAKKAEEWVKEAAKYA